MTPHRRGRGRLIYGQVFRALPGADDLEARRARPIHKLRDQRRLVAIRERIDDAGFGCPARQQRPDQRVGLDINHDNVALVTEARERMPSACGRVAGRLDDHLDFIRGDERLGIIGEER